MLLCPRFGGHSNYDLPRAFAVLCPFDVWPVLAPFLASPPEGGQS